MKKKTLGIVVCMLLIATAVLPAVGSINIDKNQELEKSVKSNDLPKPSLPNTLPPWLLVLVNGDWDYWSDSPNMFATPTGNVGIGTDTPSAKLEVKGDIRVTSDHPDFGEDPQLCISPTKISACPQALESQGLTISSYGGGSLNLESLSSFIILDAHFVEVNALHTVSINDVMRLVPRDSVPEFPTMGTIYMDDLGGGGTGMLKVFDGNAWQNCWGD